MRRLKLREWQFSLLVWVGGVCSIVTLGGAILTLTGYTAGIALKSFNPSRSEQAWKIADKTTNVTFVSFIATVVIALTASSQSDPENEDDLIIDTPLEEDISFFEAIDTVPAERGVPALSCQFLNPDSSTRRYLWCAEEPLQKTCLGCTKYTPKSNSVTSLMEEDYGQSSNSL